MLKNSRVFIGLSALLMFVAGARGAGAQVIEGTLLDADAQLPMAGAAIVMLDGDNEQIRRVVTNAQGRFTLRAPEPGTYTLVAERDGYASTVSEPITLEELQVLDDYRLTIAALRTIPLQQPMQTDPNAVSAEDLDPYEAAQRFAAMIARACEGEYVAENHAILVGVVRDQVSDVPLPLVEARVEWQGEPDESAEVHVEFDPGTGAPRTYNQLSGLTDEDGAYLICNAPADQPLQLWAAAGQEAEGNRKALRLNAGTMQRHDLILPLTTQTEPGDIWGQVLDRNSGDPVRNAEVTIDELERTPVTNDRGVFTFVDVPWGIYILRVSHLRYADAAQAFRLQGGRAHQMEVRMDEQPIELDPLTVSVRPRAWFSGMTGLQHRMDMGFGYILDREDLEVRGASEISQVLQGIPGVRVVPIGPYGATVVFRAQRNILNQGCEPQVFMDGQSIRLDPNLGLNEFNAQDLQAVEIYRSAAEVPGEFGGMESNCGALVLWTKRGIGR